MNTYRVHFTIGNRERVYDVDASHPASAIHKALQGFTTRTTSQPVDVNCVLFATDINPSPIHCQVRAR